jgi:membrane-associated protease RseP (regulator of RpoE activity)
MKISIAAFACIGWSVQLTSSFQAPSTISRVSFNDRGVFVPSKAWSPSAASSIPRIPTTQLEASPLTILASSPLGAISVLAGIVVVHEAGHYLAARSYNISVEEFSVGFGPKLLGFEALGNEFNLRALPLGGYVRFPVNFDVNATQEMESAAGEAFMKRREEEEWGPLQDALNIATFGIWDERRRKQQKQERADQAAEEAAQRSWLQKAVGGGQPKVEDDPEDFEIEYYDDPDLLQNRPWFQRSVVLSMGVIFNMLLAYSLYFGEIRFGSGIPEPVFGSGVVVSQTPMKSGAALGILQQGDGACLEQKKEAGRLCDCLVDVVSPARIFFFNTVIVGINGALLRQNG